MRVNEDIRDVIDCAVFLPQKIWRCYYHNFTI